MNQIGYGPRHTLLFGVALLVAACGSGQSGTRVGGETADGLPPYAVTFDGKRGQLQVGGPFAGVEFHHSRPFPSRISFYAPVANSIDLSTDYWKRDASLPFAVALTFGDTTDSLQLQSYVYRATPARVLFSNQESGYETEVSYRFGESLPFLALRVTVANRTSEPQKTALQIGMYATLRTSHAYATKDKAGTWYGDNGSAFVAAFDDAETDSARVFVINAGAAPSSWGARDTPDDAQTVNPRAVFTYAQTLAPGESLDVVQLIGTCANSQCNVVMPDVEESWRDDVGAYERRVNRYALNEAAFSSTDASLTSTTAWAKALLQANLHYIDGRVVPMPCPAQYNFFFTHDLLLTDLGAVMFDTRRVKDDLNYVLALAGGDSLLPHAYYWRDDGYKTEYANADNWNHLWLVVVAASYLKHSGDAATVTRLLPIIRESLRIMLENEKDGLMYASRPDWWDIGNVYGARAYITTLTIRALESFSYLSAELGIDAERASEYGRLTSIMRDQLVARLWNDEAGYLLNMLDEDAVDTHLYSGSLLAAAYDVVYGNRRATMLQTARDRLLDENIGIRNAMPPDFHTLQEVYRFNGPEVGDPYKYMNGGVWPQGIAWYVQALISAGQIDEAAEAARRFLTLDGVRNSPNGQPAFFEYREADPYATSYGQIDKTTFLWAGGFFLNVLYQLAGVRENAWNISFDATTPAEFENAEYDLAFAGEPARVTWSGVGDFFERITVNGMDAYSAVLTGPASRIQLVRGLPKVPYLSAATARVTEVSYSENIRTLTVEGFGINGQTSTFTVVSPGPLRELLASGSPAGDRAKTSRSNGLYVIEVELPFDADRGRVEFVF